MFRILAVTAALGAVFAMSATSAVAAPGGNSAAAESCQQSGFATYGTQFKNAGQCASYVAKGGTLTREIPANVRPACESSGGALDVYPESNAFVCLNFVPSPETLLILTAGCDAIGQEVFINDSGYGLGRQNFTCTSNG